MTDTGDLSTERMLQLLGQAEKRLRDQISSPSSLSSKDEITLSGKASRNPTFRFPRLSIGSLVQSHTETAQYCATVLRKPEAATKEHREGKHFRKVEDPVAVRQRSTEVSLLSSDQDQLGGNQYRIFLDADFRHRLGRLSVPAESFIYS